MSNNRTCLIQLLNSIHKVVEEFNKRYFPKKEWRAMEYLSWYIEYNFIFDDYYIFSLDEIYQAIYYDVDKEVLLEYYRVIGDGRKVNLRNFIMYDWDKKNRQDRKDLQLNKNKNEKDGAKKIWKGRKQAKKRE